MNEKSFLAAYNRADYTSPLLSVDAVLFTYHDGLIKVLLVHRSSHPDKGKWALPGGFVDEALDRNLDDTIHRKLQEKTGVGTAYLDQLGSFGGSKRDKRGWSVTVVYTAMVAHQACASLVDTVDDVRWVALEELDSLKLAFDHAQILAAARQRLRQKALYSIIPAYTLNERFTLPELQAVHEAILEKPLQKKSFRRRIELAELLIDTGEKQSEGGRPASLYRLKPDASTYTFVRNLES